MPSQSKMFSLYLKVEANFVSLQRGTFAGGIFSFFAEMYIGRVLSADGFGGRTKNPNGDTEAKDLAL